MDGSDQGSSKGKAADNGMSTGGFRAQQPMKVEKPRLEDLQKSYANVVEEVHFPGWYGSMINALGEIVGTLGAIPCCICCPNPFKKVNQGNVGLVTKFGRFYKAVDPGLVKINPLSEHLVQVDVKIQMYVIDEQSVLFEPPYPFVGSLCSPETSPLRPNASPFES